MAIEQFGNTWWGEHWLLALEKIDYDNRIPRGKRYARNGSVQEIEFVKNGIVAKVRGSRPKPYNVTLHMDKIKTSKMDQIIELSKSYPTTHIKLMNGTMDPILETIMSEQGVTLFPSQSSDMSMKCSCPDWAVPCKHIAAVLYVLCREIDNDPFTLFRFRGVDIKKLFDKHNLTINESKKLVTSLESLYKAHPIVHLDPSTQLDLNLNYSLLKNRHTEIVELLRPRPAFYPQGNFKNKYSDILSRKTKAAKRILDGKVGLDEHINFIDVKPLVFGQKCVLQIEHESIDFSEATLAQIWNVDIQVLHLHHRSIRVVHTILMFALHLISKGLITPQLIYDDEQVYYILWKPCMLDPVVKEYVEILESSIAINRAGKEYNTMLALSHMVSYLLKELYVEGDDSDECLELFFSTGKALFNDPFESSYPNSIDRWMKLFDFDLGTYYPVLKIEELDHFFHLNIEIANKENDISKSIPFESFVDANNEDSVLFDVYNDLDLLSSYISEIDQYVNNFGKEAMVYDAKTLVHFLFKVQPIMKLLNIKVVLPKSLKTLLKPKASASVSASSESRSTGIISLGGLLEFDWKVSVGEDFIDNSLFKKLLKSAGELIRYKGSYIYIDESEVSLLVKHMEQTTEITNVDKLRIVLSQEINGAPINLTDEVKKIVRELVHVDLIDTPKTLDAKLRPYQLRGYSWLVKNSMIGIGSIIADDMGLGKTLQVIAWICYMLENYSFEKKKILIIVPTSLVPNWETEFEKFAPTIGLYTHYGPQRNVNNIQGEKVILSTYGIVRSDLALLKKIKWAATIIDEAQNIKNPTAQQTKAIKSIKAEHHIAMSGTPVENGLLDYWSIMDYTNKGILLNKTNFKKTFINPIVKDKDAAVLEKFGKITAPFILRRLKTDKTIISDLPEKIVQDLYVPLSIDQGALYQKTLDEALTLIKASETSDHKSLFKRQGLILQMILALKQICNHPAQWLKNGDKRIELSGKLLQLMDRLDTIFTVGDKVLIFTQFREMGDIIKESIQEKYGLDALWLHGGVSLKNRKIMVDQFQNEDHQKVMILSLKAGGTGLNLTAANHVVHYDLWWNPAVENQASDRAFRIGQKKNVFIYRMITKNTFEEKINLMIQSKLELANLTISSGESWIGQLNNEELEELFI